MPKRRRLDDFLKGDRVFLRKVLSDGTSSISPGEELAGVLREDVAVGSPIFIVDGSKVANTSEVQDVYRASDGYTYVRTRTSTYRIMAGESENRESSEEKKPKRVITSRGSVYTYLDDGRTQRFKEATGEMQEPMDLLVFVPPWEVIAEEARKRYPNLSGIENDNLFNQFLLEVLHGYDSHYHKTAIGKSDGSGVPLSRATSNNQIAGSAFGKVFLVLMPREGSGVDQIALPVSVEPKEGWRTYDQGVTSDGKSTIRHLGNKVVRVEYV